jgi:SSS family solute:Na+ symporter
MKMTMVLELMLYSYAFMVAGLLIPVLAIIIQKKPDSMAAFYAMLVGGGSTLILIIFDISMPFGIAANVYGLGASGLIYIILYHIRKYIKIN